MTILEELEPLSQRCIEKNIPLISAEKAQWLLDFIATKQEEKKKKTLRVLELGTAYGYSALLFALSGCNIVTVEKDEERLAVARKEIAKVKEKSANEELAIEMLAGDGRAFTESFANNSEEFDIIFIDYAKWKYVKVLPYALAVCAKDAVIIADNVMHPHCSSYRELLAQMQEDAKVSTEYVDIGDGLSVTRKTE